MNSKHLPLNSGHPRIEDNILIAVIVRYSEDLLFICSLRRLFCPAITKSSRKDGYLSFWSQFTNETIV